jgi:putative NADH-flavin reductase
MQLIVFGSTGGIGRNIVTQALDQGHYVTAVARNPPALGLTHRRLSTVKGDVFRPESFQMAMKGQDAVLSAIGVNSTKPTTVYSEGIANIVKAMQQNEVSRIIGVSASAVETSPKLSFPFRIMTRILQRILRNMYRDLLQMESILKQTNLNWTVVRPPKLTNEPATGNYRCAVNDHLVSCLRISRADLADFMLRHLEERSTYRSIIEIAY